MSTAFTKPNLLKALETPTIQTQEDGYAYDAVGPDWRNACAVLPSFAAVHWPGYATAVFHGNINGRDVIIQPWMGQCEQFLWGAKSPGGFGGEVGVYVRVPEGKPLPDIGALPGPMASMMKYVQRIGGDALWWPDPTMQPEMDFTIYDPNSRTVLAHAKTDGDYWLTKWMQPESYNKFRAAHAHLPDSLTEFEMKFTVAGVTRKWIPSPPEL